MSAPEGTTTTRKAKKSVYVRWAILVVVLIIIVTATVKALPLLASASSPTVSVTPAATPDFAPFTGNWYGHGRFLEITSNGHAHYGARTYQWCGQGVSGPCDTLQGNEIIGGIDEQLVFTRTSGSSAYGTIITSTVGETGQQVSVALQQNDTLALYHRSTLYTLLCGPKAPAGTCGA